MGNCLMRTTKVSSQDHDGDENYEAPFEAKVEHTKISSSSSSSLSKLEAPPMKEKSTKFKKVRFRTQKDDNINEFGDNSGDSRSGSSTVRIRVVMTREELKRILNCNDSSNNNKNCDDSKNNNTLEQLLSAVKMRGGKVSEVSEYDDGGISSSWKPALESIPEDCLIN